MIASVSTYLTSAQPDLTPAPAKVESPPLQAPPPSQTDKPVAAQPAQADTVDISSKALDLNKMLSERENPQGAVQQERKRQQEQTVQEKSPYESAGKQYPPFLGNTEELKLLKQTAPALYREILKMIVPPPANLSYSDRQLLEGSRNR